MPNNTWKPTLLQISDLPAKAQRFIEVMNIDISDLKLIHLEADPNGKYFKIFAYSGTNPNGQYASHEKTVYIIENLRVGVIIHELTHFYLEHNKHDVEAIAKKHINQCVYGTLSNYAVINVLKAEGKIPLDEDDVDKIDVKTVSDNDISNKKVITRKWEEVVCEIIAKYGRRGQFDKIKELFDK